jgi:hypothetical protein
MPRAQNSLIDGFATLSGGMHSGISPSLLPINQNAYSVNTTYRKGFMRTRPKFRQIALNWQDNIDSEDWFNQHPITGSQYFQSANGQQFLIAASGGRFFSFSIKGNSATVNDITPSSGRMSMIASQTWMCQAAQYLVAQDGVSIPFLWDGATSRYANYSDPQNPEVPTGKQMAYINDRLFVVMPNGLTIQAGDLTSVSPTSVITFSENAQPAIQGGQPINLPVQDQITCLIPTAQLNTLAGQGVLLAITSTTVCSINAIIQRNLWPSLTPFQNVALIGNGFLNQGCAQVNSDVWGRSVDGWRSYRMAIAQFNEKPGNVVQSYEIQRILDKDTEGLLQYASFVYFDNRLLGTVSPVKIVPGCYHRGIAVIDFVNTCSLTQAGNPDYDGLWTGIQPYSLVKGIFNGSERCFAFCYQGENQNSLWEITKEYGDDNDTHRITSMCETRAFNFRTSEQAQKQYLNLPSSPKYMRLDDFELWVDRMRGQVDFDLKYRPDQFPCWFDWKCWTKAAKENNCDEEPLDETSCLTPQSFLDQYRPRMVMGQPPILCEPAVEKLSTYGYEFQLRLQWTGQCRIRVGRIYACEKDVNPWTLELDAI